MMENRKVDLSWLDVSPKKRVRRDKPGPARRERPGRPALHEQHPQVVPVAREFIDGNGFRAHRRRRNEIGTCGTSVPQLRDHLLATLPDMKEDHPNLCRRTVARMMHAPNKGVRAAAAYKELIPARVPKKENSVRKSNENSHFCSSRVRYILEMAAKLGERAMVFSADNKNKIRVGDVTLAVDRRITINRLYPIDDSPNYNDHDFPLPGYLLTPAGYLEMTPRPIPVMTRDDLGRERLEIPQKGKAIIVLRSPHSTNNVASHMNDMARHLDIANKVENGKAAMVLLVDGGPDFNSNHLVNEFFYARFFRDTALDAMVVTAYAPGDSALNPIEHVWGPCTRSLTSAYLGATLPGDSCPPCKQNLPAEQRIAKEHQVFDAAMNKIKDNYWNSVKYAGKKVAVEVEESGADLHPYGADFDAVKILLNGSATQLRQSTIFSDYSFMAQHMDKRLGTVILAKCDERDCEHCQNHPPVLSSPEMDLFRHFPTPKPSDRFPGHFITFLEAIATSIDAPCQHMPQFHAKGLGRCQVEGCRYVFTSQKDVRDHRLRVHRR